MRVLDLVLLALVAVFAFAGWRQGLIRGALSMAGFLGGALLAVLVIPQLLGSWGAPVLTRGIVSIGGVLAFAVAGQALARWTAKHVRDSWTWRPAQLVDSACGAAFYVISLAVVMWVVASALLLLPENSLSTQVRDSRMVAALDAMVPGPARHAVLGLQTMLSGSGFPTVFAGFIEPPVIPVDPPDPAVLADPAVRRASGSLVLVDGIADACSEEITGSGFVFAPNRVMTNAHVVAGVTNPQVQVLGTGAFYSATVVYFDPAVDVAVLAVPDLAAPALRFGPDAIKGTSAVVAGFPGGGSLTAEPARVRGRLSARGENIYGTSPVFRDIYAVRGRVLPGNSGGPLLSDRGTVFGVVFAAAVNDSGTGYALTADQVRSAADAGRSATAQVPTGSCVTAD